MAGLKKSEFVSKGGQNPAYTSDEKSKGFSQSGIPTKLGLTSIEGGATEMTSAEKETNKQKSDVV